MNVHEPWLPYPAATAAGDRHATDKRDSFAGLLLAGGDCAGPGASAEQSAKFLMDQGKLGNRSL